MKIAVFTIGADEIRMRKMIELAQAWGFEGRYSDTKTLLDNARKKRFDTVLVLDHYAIDDNAKKELASLNVEIIGLNDKKKLERKIL
jgi:hypothetical protein